MRTQICGRWVVGYQEGKHCIIPCGEVVYEDDTIIYVGTDYDGAVDKTVDASDHLLIPGFINLHYAANVDDQILRIDSQSHGFPKPAEFWSSDHNILNQRQTRWSARQAIRQALRMGSTTVGAITSMTLKRWEDPKYEPPIIAEAMENIGIRGYVAHQFRMGDRIRGAGTAGTTDDNFPKFWNEQQGQKGLERAVEFVKMIENTGSDRVHGYLFPYTLETCSASLLQDVKSEADSLGVHMRTHFAQSEGEIKNIKERSGKTPVFYLEDLGVLDRNVILTHGIYMAGTAGTPYPDGRELDLLADRGVTICHEPLVFARGGVFLDSFSRYRSHGINMAMGSDTFPPDIFNLMRCATSANNAVEQRNETNSVREVFNAATLGGSRALGREDIGRLKPGAKADIVAVDLSGPHIGYVDDPIWSLINRCYGTDVDRVVVDGVTRVKDGQVTHTNNKELNRGAEEVMEKFKSTFLHWDDQNRMSEELFTSSFSNRSDSK